MRQFDELFSDPVPKRLWLDLFLNLIFDFLSQWMVFEGSVQFVDFFQIPPAQKLRRRRLFGIHWVSNLLQMLMMICFGFS